MTARAKREAALLIAWVALCAWAISGSHSLAAALLGCCVGITAAGLIYDR